MSVRKRKPTRLGERFRFGEGNHRGEIVVKQKLSLSLKKNHKMSHRSPRRKLAHLTGIIAKSARQEETLPSLIRLGRVCPDRINLQREQAEE